MWPEIEGGTVHTTSEIVLVAEPLATVIASLLCGSGSPPTGCNDGTASHSAMAALYAR